MKIVSFQPKYAKTIAEQQNLVEWLCNELDSCDPSMDLIVLPEACNAMCYFGSREEFYSYAEKNEKVLIDKAKEKAARCNAVIAINSYFGEGKDFQNITMLFGRDGKIVGSYSKQHLPVSEKDELHLISAYTQEFREPQIVEYEGLKYAFLTCYDCYFNEYIQQIAKYSPDIIIVCSLQRTETMHMLEAQMKMISFTSNAFSVRSSVSMGDEDYPYGANSMIVAPDGEVLAKLGQSVGKLIVDIDPLKKHYRPNSFNHPNILNNLFVENGRTPWAYRTCGPSVIPGDRELPYPRVCSHRGFNMLVPENTMAAFGLAIALGADEIELDVWPTKDGKLVVCHDLEVDRTSNGHGKITEMTWAEIQQLEINYHDISWCPDKYTSDVSIADHLKNLRFPLLDEVFAKFSRQVIINLHIKSVGNPEEGYYDKAVYKKILDLIYKYDMQNHVYIAGEEDVMKTACEMSPELPRAALDGKLDFSLVKLAKKYHCDKIQFFRPFFTQEMIDEAKEAGIRCNLFWTDTAEEVPDWIRDGIDTILSNEFLQIKNALVEYQKK